MVAFLERLKAEAVPTLVGVNRGVGAGHSDEIVLSPRLWG